MSEPQYVIEDTLSNKDGNEYYGGSIDTIYQVPNLHQIQPILSVPHIIASVKQSLEDLDAALRPSSWSRVQHKYNQQNPDNKTTDLPI
jgi:hypothetical protein